MSEVMDTLSPDTEFLEIVSSDVVSALLLFIDTESAVLELLSRIE